MTTSGATSFDLEFTELAEEAFERAVGRCARVTICARLAAP